MCIENPMHASALRTWKKSKNITSDHISWNAQAIIRLFIYNILNKIVKKRKQENATITHLWTCNSVMASTLLTCFTRFLSRNFDNWKNCGEKNKPKIVLIFTSKHKFYSNWKLSKLRKSAIQKSCIALYNTITL